jgi:hypothetical protein
MQRSEERRYQRLMLAHRYLGALPKMGETLTVTEWTPPVTPANLPQDPVKSFTRRCFTLTEVFRYFQNERCFCEMEGRGGD